MKKLAKLTALLLTGVMLLLLASCGAAPNPDVPGGSSGLTAAEAKARREIFNAINEERQKVKILPLLREDPKLTQLEQEFIEHFREAGTNGLSLSDARQFEQELTNKQKEAGWQWNGSFNFSAKEPVKLSHAYEGDTPEFREELRRMKVAVNDGSVALSVGVVTIEGKIYWTVTFLKPIT